MRITLLLVLGFVIQSYTFSQVSQELNIGGFVGTEIIETNFRIVNVGATVEYRLVNALVSFNSDLLLSIYDNEMFLTVPLYLKFIIGNKIRFCPTGGIFVRQQEITAGQLASVLSIKLKNSYYYL